MQGVSDCNSTWPAGFWSNPTWTGPIWVLLFCEWGLWILTIKSETVWSSLSLRKYSLFEKQCLVLAKTTSYHAHCLFFFFFLTRESCTCWRSLLGCIGWRKRTHLNVAHAGGESIQKSNTDVIYILQYADKKINITWTIEYICIIVYLSLKATCYKLKSLWKEYYIIILNLMPFLVET